MIPIPAYRNHYAGVVKMSESWIQFSVSRDCGSRSFMLFQNTYTAEEQSTVDLYFVALHDLHSGCWGSACTKEVVDYQPHFWKKCRTAVGVEVKAENDLSLATFKENTGMDLDLRCES